MLPAEQRGELRGYVARNLFQMSSSQLEKAVGTKLHKLKKERMTLLIEAVQELHDFAHTAQ